MRLGAIVPAAGLSRRMGREKILLPFGRSTILETVLRTLLEAGVAPKAIAVVLRPDLEGAHDLAARAGSTVLVNPDPAGEMMSSIRLGLAGLPDADADAIDAFFVWPADHPAVSLGTIRLLGASADRDLVWIPRYRARRGHPAVVGRALAPAVAAVPDGLGLRELWRLRADAVREVDVEDPGVVANLDTPAEYEAARRLRSDRDERSPPGHRGV